MTKKPLAIAISAALCSALLIACSPSENNAVNANDLTSSTTSALHSPPESNTTTPLLWTDNHKDQVLLANSLLLEPDIQRARQQVIDLYRNSPSGQLADGQNTLESAVDSLIYGALLASGTRNLADAKMVWSETLDYSHDDITVADNRYAGETPDRIYRNVVLSSAYHYQLHGQYDPATNLDFSIEVIPGPANWGLPPLAVLQAKNITFDADGAFTITIDADPAGDRANHLQLPAASKGLLIRDTIGDWAKHKAVALSLINLDANTTPDLSKNEIIQRTTETIINAAQVSLKFYGGIWKRELNQLTTYVRDLGWGIVGLNRFSIADDEALVVTIDPLNAEYFGIQVDDLWLRSVNYYQYTSSLNLNQSTPNPDGTYTYVIALQDPGYQNWIDTGGLNEGYLVARWELFPEATQGEGAVKSVKKVALSELPEVMPEGSPIITAEARVQRMANRRKDYDLRMGKH